MRQPRDVWTLLYATLFALTFVGYPVLSSGLGAFDAYARVFSIIYRAFVVFSALALFWIVASRLSVDAWRGYVVVAFCALWAMLLARFVWDSSFVPIPLQLPWFDNFLIMIGAVLIPTVALFQAPSERAFDVARRIILCGGAFAGVFLVAAVLRIVREQNSFDALRRLGTDELNPISLGNVAVVLVIVSLLGQPLPPSSSRIARIIDNRAVRLSAGMLGALLVVASASKGPILALLMVIVVAQVARIVRRGSVRELMAAATRFAFVLFGLFVLAVLLAVFFNVRVLDRFVDFSADASTSIRVGMITRALLQFESSPWLGSALVETQARFYPHNLFVDVLMNIGIPGFCALLVILLAAARAAFRLLYTRHEWVVLLFLQQQIGIMFSGSVYVSAEFWVSIAALLGLERMLSQQSPRTLERSEPRLAVGER